MSVSRTAAAYEVAEDQYQRGDYKAAAASCLEVLQVSQSAAEGPSVAVISAVQRLAEIAVLAGEWDAAVEHLNLARVAFAECGNAYMADYVSTRIASVQNARGMGRSAAAVLSTLESRPLRKWDGSAGDLAGWETEWAWSQVSAGDRAAFFSRYYLELGQVEAYGGQFERAVHLLRRGLDWARDSPDAGAATALCLALVSAHLQRGDMCSAAAALDLVPAHLDERTQPGDAVFRLELKARLDLLAGRLGSAKTSLERAIDICRGIGSQAAWRTAVLNLSQVLLMLNQTAEASRLCEEVLESARVSGDNGAELRARYLRRFADDRTYSLVGGASLARSVTEMWNERAAASKGPGANGVEPTPFDLGEAPDYLTLFEERALGFFWLLSRGRIDAAASYLNELERIFLEADPPTDSLIIRMRLHGCACTLAYYQERYEEALHGFSALCDHLRELGLKHDLWQALRFCEWTFVRLGRVTEADAVGLESKQVLAEMGATLAGADLVLFLLNKWTDAERYMAGEIEALLTMKRALSARRWRARLMRPVRRLTLARRLAALLDYADRYKAAVFERPTTDGPPAPAPPARRSILRLLTYRRSNVTVAWIVLPDVTLVARAGWASLDFGVSGVSRIELREAVKLWHEAIRNRDPATATAAMRRLRAALQIDEIMETLPRRIRAITFVPDDILHGVPFAAFRYGETAEELSDQYLGASHEVAISFEWSPRTRRKRVGQSALVVGLPYGSGRFAPLPNAAREARKITERLRAQGLSVRNAETREEILKYLPESVLCHIACHGYFHPVLPDHSGLVIVSPGGESQLLTIRDLAELDLRALEQVVLSSCWAADSYIIPGRWIVSVPSALCRRGARVVVGSLWPIDDDVAEAFFLPIYDASSSNRSIERRLLDVRRRFITASEHAHEEELDDPFFWAGVQVYRRD